MYSLASLIVERQSASDGAPGNLSGGAKLNLIICKATIGAMCVGLDELPDSEAIRGFVGGEGNVFAHELVSVF